MKKKANKRERRILSNLNQDNKRIIAILDNIIADPMFSPIRLGYLAKKLSNDHNSIILLFSRRNINYTLNSNLNLFAIKVLKSTIMNDPLPSIPLKKPYHRKGKHQRLYAQLISTPM